MSAAAVHQLFDAYYDAFARDPAAAAANYADPILMVAPGRADLHTRADVEARLSRMLARLKANGYARSELGAPTVTFLSDKTALYSTVAMRLRADGSEVERAGYTYLVVDGPSGWKIHAAMATDLDKLPEAA